MIATITANIPWSILLPSCVLGAFVVGTLYKRGQDMSVKIVRNTIRPGEVHIDDLRAFAAKQSSAG